MELTETTLAHLRDEAYAFLAREALVAKLGELERERQAVETTRPPFGGMLASRGSRDEFARSMRAVSENETVLKDQLTQIMGIVEWLHPIIRRDVSSYLAGASPDYCHLLQIYARFDDWAQAYRQAPELLVAFARDVHAVQLVVAVAKKGASALAHELAVLRASTERFAGLWHELGMIERAALTLAPAGLAKPIRFPALPEAQSPGWVSRLAVMAPEQALSEVIRVESEVRAFLAGPRERVAAELEICRDECGQIVNQVLEEYWAQLRAHARLYYVEERDTADVIAMLTQRYVDRDIQRRQRVISASPFGPER